MHSNHEKHLIQYVTDSLIQRVIFAEMIVEIMKSVIAYVFPLPNRLVRLDWLAYGYCSRDKGIIDDHSWTIWNTSICTWMERK
jgi:hypothetical protein